MESPKVATSTAVTPSELKVIYPSLKANERRTLTQCRYCSKEFHFVSEHLLHLKMHVSDVNAMAEMYLKIWVQDRKLKCDRCKNKTKYTLDYAQHADTHAVPGLCCAECRDEVETPAEYARHMEIHHHSVLFASGSLPEPMPQPGEHNSQDLFQGPYNFLLHVLPRSRIACKNASGQFKRETSY